jgi:haloalkane dehalogenase
LFAQLVPHLQGYRLIAPDMLGQGRTETPAAGRLDFAAYLEHLEAFLDTIPPHPFHLLVHDFGAVLGLTWATRHLDRVRSVIVLSTTVSFGPRVVLLVGANLILGPRLIEWFLPWTLQRSRNVLPRHIQRQWAMPWTRRRLLRGMDHFGAAHLRNLRKRLDVVTRPVLLIWGEADTVFPVSHGDQLRKALPNAVLETIPACGHWATLDAPCEVARHIRAFCSTER